jgi:hypothetical protein
MLFFTRPGDDSITQEVPQLKAMLEQMTDDRPSPKPQLSS